MEKFIERRKLIEGRKNTIVNKYNNYDLSNCSDKTLYKGGGVLL